MEPGAERIRIVVVGEGIADDPELGVAPGVLGVRRLPFWKVLSTAPLKHAYSPAVRAFLPFPIEYVPVSGQWAFACVVLSPLLALLTRAAINGVTTDGAYDS